MAHLNMTYLLELPAGDYLARARELFAGQPETAAVLAAAADDTFADVIAISQPKVRGLDELPDYTVYFFTEEFPWNPKAIAKVFKKGEPLARLAELRDLLAGLDLADEAGVEEAIKAAAEARGFGFGDYQAVARLAVTGTNAGPGLTQIFRVLGREKVLARIDRFLASPPAVD